MGLRWHVRAAAAAVLLWTALWIVLWVFLCPGKPVSAAGTEAETKAETDAGTEADVEAEAKADTGAETDVETGSAEACSHIFRTEIKDATERGDGRILYVCRLCGYSRVGRIPRHGHTFAVRVREPGWKRPGLRIRICTRCGRICQEEYGAPLNIGDAAFLVLELAAVNLAILILCIYRHMRRWHLAQAEEYQRHHIKWRSSA